MNRHILVIIFLILSSSFTKAQTALSSDELFKNAREAAFEHKDYDKARKLANQALAISPAYADIDIFLGRVYSWSSQYDSARYHFTKVLTANPANEDASIALIDLEYWNDHYDNALKTCNQALTLDSASEELLLRKARILNATKKYKEASVIVKALSKSGSHNKAVLALANSLKDAVAVNKLSISYDHTSFDKQYDQP